MFRVAIPGRRSLVAILLGTVAVVGGCASSEDGSVEPAPPAFTITLGAQALTVPAGASAMTSIMAIRSRGLTSPVTYAITTSTPGLTGTLATTGIPDRSTLTVQASAALPAGEYSVTLDATATGAAPQQATIAVTVSATAGNAPDIASVAAGAHFCAVATDGAASCWGYNALGQLGNGEMSQVNPVPVTVAGSIAFKQVSVSKVEGVSCGLSTEGAAYCWGENSSGQAGDGSAVLSHPTPTPVAGGLTFGSIAVGNGHVCALATDGKAWCWGTSPNGAFGDGTVGQHLTPAVGGGGMTFESIVAGSDFSCALTPAGRAWCWGLGFQGQLGNGLATNSLVPVEVSGGLTFRSLAAGGASVCGVTTDGAGYCWGADFFGTLGDGSGALVDGITRRVSPVAVQGGLTFESISAGYETMCGVTPAGAGYCWGYNAGEVGDGTLDHRVVPTPVAGGLAFRSISAGTAAACGVTTSRAVFCWGDNSNGELGDGTTTHRLVPVPVRWP